MNEVGSRISVKLDLAKYGLSHLENMSLNTWTDAGVDNLIKAFATENIAPSVFGISFSPTDVNRLLNKSYCRRCGRCCLPDPKFSEHPGIMVYEQDLRLIAQYTRYSYKFLKKKAKLNEDSRWERRRYIPLPCIFYEKGVCKIYEIRPLVCRTYPITDIPDKDGININVRCEYGVDIYKSVIQHLRTGKPTSLFSVRRT